MDKNSRAKRKYLIAFFAACLCFFAFYSATQLKIVSIADSNGFEKKLLTRAMPTAAIIEASGIATDENCELSVTSSFMREGIYIDRSFPVSIACDHDIHTGSFDSGSVGDALEALGIELGKDDRISHSTGDSLERDMQIAIERIEYKTENWRMEVPQSQEQGYIASLSQEAAEAFVRSPSRIYDAELTVEYSDGERSSEAISGLKAVIHPFDSPNDDIFTGKAVSSINRLYGVELGADGIPTSYKRKIAGAVCTAYSASSGRGAGGLGLYCGTVAVDSAKIPYGSRLYIRSSDGSFIYGYAIATDTGTSMMAGRVDIDLYFESNRECNAFGLRNLDVYVLD
jgi:3D (Asp-Asp-Asp) domain-containing protein